MSALASFAVGEITVRQHNGLFSLNDLHQAAGAESKHQPALFLRLDSTQALIEELKAENLPTVETKRGAGGGTYVARELVIAYGAWVNAAFHLKVIRVFLAVAAPQSELQQMHPAYAVNPGDTLTQAQADELRDLMERAAQKLPKDKRGAFLQSGWAKLRKHTGVNYRKIPQSAHADALSLLARHTVDWELVDEDPAPKLGLDDTARLDMAFHLASNAATQVQRAVFNTVMGDKGLGSMSSQWMLYFHTKSWGDKSMDAYCKPLAIDAICLGPDAYLANLERGDGHILTSDQLARMAEFSIKKLASRMRQHASPAKAAA